jgi:hypothetical protein
MVPGMIAGILGTISLILVLALPLLEGAVTAIRVN